MNVRSRDLRPLFDELLSSRGVSCLVFRVDGHSHDDLWVDHATVDMIIEANRIYDHGEHGQVVVIGIHDIYNKIDTESGHGSGAETVVRFASAWDHFGPLPGGGGGEPLDEFVAKATGPIQTDPPEFVED